MKLDEKALEAAKNAFALEGGHDATRWLEAAIRSYLSAVPSSPVSDLLDPVAYRARHSVVEKWCLFTSPVSWWECQPLYAESAVKALSADVATLKSHVESAEATLTTLSVRNAELERGIDRLAAYIMENVPGEPSENQGAVDTAIRLLGKNAELEREVKRLREFVETARDYAREANDDGMYAAADALLDGDEHE